MVSLVLPGREGKLCNFTFSLVFQHLLFIAAWQNVVLAQKTVAPRRFGVVNWAGHPVLPFLFSLSQVVYSSDLSSHQAANENLRVPLWLCRGRHFVLTSQKIDVLVWETEINISQCALLKKIHGLLKLYHCFSSNSIILFQKQPNLFTFILLTNSFFFCQILFLELEPHIYIPFYPDMHKKILAVDLQSLILCGLRRVIKCYNCAVLFV